MWRKSQPNFQHNVKEIEALAKKRFSYKKKRVTQHRVFWVKKVDLAKKKNSSFEFSASRGLLFPFF